MEVQPPPMINAYIAAIYGALVNVVDDIIDADIFPRHRLAAQLLLMAFTVYILFFNRSLSLIAAPTFSLGGAVALVCCPHAVAANIWKAIILASVVPFLGHVPTIGDAVRGCAITDMWNLLYFVVPLFIVATVFSLVEDRLIPEEIGKAKLVSKAFQVAVAFVFLLSLESISRRLDLAADLQTLLAILASGWLGYVASSVLVLVALHKLKGLSAWGDSTAYETKHYPTSYHCLRSHELRREPNVGKAAPGARGQSRVRPSSEDVREAVLAATPNREAVGPSRDYPQPRRMHVREPPPLVVQG